MALGPHSGLGGHGHGSGMPSMGHMAPMPSFGMAGVGGQCVVLVRSRSFLLAINFSLDSNLVEDRVSCDLLFTLFGVVGDVLVCGFWLT